jgi:hypothetical protein
VPVRVLAAAAASWRCAVLACGPYDSEARLLAAARRRADLLWYARVCVRAERPEGPWTLVADLPAPRTEADHCEPCTTWHRQPMHSPRATCHEGSHTDVLESLRSLLSPLLACAFSSHHSWLGLAGVDGTCAGEDPFLFIDKRGAFHILAHVYGVQQYPLNPISGPRKNSSLSRFRSSSFCGWWPFFRFVPSLSWQDVVGFSNVKTHRRAFTLQVTRLAQTAPTTAGPSPRQSHTGAQKALLVPPFRDRLGARKPRTKRRRFVSVSAQQRR